MDEHLGQDGGRSYQNVISEPGVSFVEYEDEL